MFKFHLKFILFVGIVFAFSDHRVEATPIQLTPDLHPITYKVTHKVVIDDVIDKNIDQIRLIAARLDPMNIRDDGFKVTDGIYMSLYNGWLQNLSQLRRDGKCTLMYSDKILTADLNFAWDDLAFDYRYIVKALLYSREGDLHGQMSNLKVNIRLDIDLENYHIILKKLDFVNSGKISVRLEGNRLDYFLNLAIKTATDFLKILVVQMVEFKSIDMLQADIDDINQQLSGLTHRDKMFTFVDLVGENSIY